MELQEIYNKLSEEKKAKARILLNSNFNYENKLEAYCWDMEDEDKGIVEVTVDYVQCYTEDN